MSELSKLRNKCNQCFDLHRHQCIKEYDCEIDKKMSELQEQEFRKASEKFLQEQEQEHINFGKFLIEKITDDSMKIILITNNTTIRIKPLTSNSIEIISE